MFSDDLMLAAKWLAAKLDIVSCKIYHRLFYYLKNTIIKPVRFHVS